jgi:flagellar basal-body rod protein FlgB
VFEAVTPLQGALDYHLERHNVLSSNVAHVDTPGYRAVDLERVDTSAFAGTLAVALARTSSAHLAGGAAGATPVTGRVINDLTAGAGNDGNYVSLDREAAKVASNHLRYDVISAVVQAELRQLRFAVSDAKG